MNAKAGEVTKSEIKWMGIDILLSKSESLFVCFTLIAFQNHTIGSKLEIVKLERINVCGSSHQIPLLLSPMPHKNIVLIQGPLQKFLTQGH